MPYHVHNNPLRPSHIPGDDIPVPQTVIPSYNDQSGCVGEVKKAITEAKDEVKTEVQNGVNKILTALPQESSSEFIQSLFPSES